MESTDTPKPEAKKKRLSVPESFKEQYEASPITPLTMADIQAEIRDMFISFHAGKKFDFVRLAEIAEYGQANL